MVGAQENLELVPGDAWSLLTKHSYGSWSENSHNYGDSWPESHVLKSQRYLSFLTTTKNEVSVCKGLSGIAREGPSDRPQGAFPGQHHCNDSTVAQSSSLAHT